MKHIIGVLLLIPAFIGFLYILYSMHIDAYKERFWGFAILMDVVLCMAMGSFLLRE